jgi:hypothetical protein
VEWRVRAGDEPPIHTHTREDETLYVLEGAITAYVGDQRIDVEAGRTPPCRRTCRMASLCVATKLVCS